MDEIASPADADKLEPPLTSGSAKGPVRAYHEAVLDQRQPKVTDLLPVRPLWVVVLFAVRPRLASPRSRRFTFMRYAAAETDGGGALAALDARQRGSLAAWYASAMLAAAAGLAQVVFGIRCPSRR